MDNSISTVLNVLDTLGKDFDVIVAPCNSVLQLSVYKTCCAVPQEHSLSGKKYSHPTISQNKLL